MKLLKILFRMTFIHANIRYSHSACASLSFVSGTGMYSIMSP